MRIILDGKLVDVVATAANIKSVTPVTGIDFEGKPFLVQCNETQLWEVTPVSPSYGNPFRIEGKTKQVAVDKAVLFLNTFC